MLTFNSDFNETGSELRLCNEPIVPANSFKYLRIEISSNYSNKEHIKRRSKAVSASLANLKMTNVLSNQ